MEKIDARKVTQFTQAHRWGSSAVVCLFTAATFFLFGPINLYVSNKNEFVFYLRDILPYLLGIFALAFVVLTVLCGLIRSDKARHIALAVILGIGLGFYVQGNFLSGGYGELNGQSIDWASMTGRGIVNTLIWSVCIALPAALVLFVKKWKAVWMQYAAGALIAVQLLATVLACIMAPAKQDVDFTVTSDGAFTLSGGQNVVIFLLDNFRSDLFEEIITEDEAYLEEFSGFTYFPDAAGVGCNTKGSMPFLLTGVWNENRWTFSEYIRHAYRDNPLYETLEQENYDTRLYVSSRYISAESTDYFANIEGGATTDSALIVPLMYKFTAFVYMPHFLKQNFWMYSGDFSASSSDEMENAMQLSPDGAFYGSMCKNGLGISSEYENAFRFYYLNGAHEPYTLSENAEMVEAGSVTEKQQATGALKIVADYLEMVRQEGIYEDTMVVLLADHGTWTDRETVVNPMLCIKPFGAGAEPLTISDAQISYEDLHPTICKAITGDDSLTGAFDISEDEMRERRFMWYIWDDSWDSEYLPELSELYIVGNVRDLSSRQWTGVCYTERGKTKKDFSYTLGTELTYTGEAFDSANYFYGLSSPENGYTWTDGEWANWNFTPDDYVDGALTFQIFYCAAKDDKQDVELYVNGYTQSVTATSDGTNEIVFTIPEEYVGDGVLSLYLRFPDRSAGETDVRELGLAICSVVLDYENQPHGQ